MPPKKHPSIENITRHSETYRPQFRWAFLSPRFWMLWLVLFLLGLLSVLPWRLRSVLAWPLGRLLYFVSRKRRRIARLNLKWCFPKLAENERRRWVKKHFYWRIRIAFDYGIFWWGSAKRIQRLVRVEGLMHFKQCYEQQKPIILLSCHCLALDVGGTVLAIDYPVVSLVKAARNPLADWLLQRGRLRFNAVLYQRTGGMAPAVRAMRKGLFFYYLPDEDLGGDESVFAPFFGVNAATLATLGRLTTLCRASVIPSYTRYVEGKGYYVNTLSPPLTEFPRPTVQEDAQCMNQELERMILTDLTQYMWTMKRFKRRPDNAKSPYDI